MYTSTRSFQLIFLFAMFMLVSCASNEIGQSKDVNQETIYQQYDITFDENDNKTELIAQFRFAGINGTTLVLNAPSRFEFDGELLKVDSSDFAGAFYKMVLSGKNSFGKHRLVFTDIDKRKFENEFSIENFRLTQVPASLSKTTPAMVRFEAPLLRDDDYVELSTDNTDSSFTIRHLATDSGNAITIPLEQLQRQKGKSFSLSAMLYRKRTLNQQAREGGAIKVIQVTKPVMVHLYD